MRYRLKTIFYLTALAAFVAWWLPRNMVRVHEDQTTLIVESVLPIEWIDWDLTVSYLSPCEAIVWPKPVELCVVTAIGRTYFQREGFCGPYRMVGHSR